MDAMRNLLEAIRGVRIDSHMEVKDFIAGDKIMSQISGFVKGAHVINREYMSDGTVEVTMEMNLGGELSDLVLPVSSSVTDTTLSPSEKSVYTGLVVDTRGLGIRPAMAPKILDENGQEVYGTSLVSREYAVKQGMAGYAKSVQDAVISQRVTDKPLTVRGLKAEGPGTLILLSATLMPPD